MQTLRHLSDGQLLHDLQRHLRQSREATAELLRHLAEVEHRSLHLKAGFSSMFRYVTEKLGFSEGGAYRRIQVARLCRRAPAVLPLIASGRLHLAGAALLAPILNRSNQQTLLAAASGKSKRAIEALVAAHNPRPLVSDALRRLPRPQTRVHLPLALPTAGSKSPTVVSGSTALAPPAPDPRSACSTAPQREWVADRPVVPGNPPAAPIVATCPRPSATPLSADRFKIQFTASTRTVAKLEQARALLSHRQVATDLDALFGQALTLLCQHLEKERFALHTRAARRPVPDSGWQVIEKEPNATLPGDSAAPPHSPQRDSIPTAANDSRDPQADSVTGQTAPTPLSRAALTSHQTASPSQTNPSRHIPNSIKRQVYTRDGGRCTFVGSDGTRCGEQRYLTFHHTRPWARHRRHETDEVVLMCHSHNQLLAKRDFGAPTIAQAIARSRGSSKRDRETAADTAVVTVAPVTE